jgi:hypothetical protein
MRDEIENYFFKITIKRTMIKFDIKNQIGSNAK